MAVKQFFCWQADVDGGRTHQWREQTAKGGISLATQGEEFLEFSEDMPSLNYSIGNDK